MKKTGTNKKRLMCTVLSAALLTSSLNITAIAAVADRACKDGVYTGTAKGRNGDITVSVTVSDGNISSIDVAEQKETPEYWEDAKEIIPKIIAANKTEGVDAVSGATISSEAIKEAVDNALAQSSAPDCFDGGVGTVDDPYIIKNASQLAAFAKRVDDGENFSDKFIALDADIDLSDAGAWNPIGAEGSASANLDKLFAGSFSGRDHVIRGLTIKTEDNAPYTVEQNVGLFSTLLSTAKVSDIRMEDVDIDVTGDKVVMAGAITGDITSNAVSGTEAHAIVDNCTVKGSVSAQTDAAMVMTGGVIGRASGNAYIINCVSEAKVASSSGTKIAYGGGIVSMSGNDTFIVNCANKGDISVSTASGFSLYAGGIAGMMTSEQYNCFSTGNVTVGTIAQTDAASNAGIISGSLMPAASGDYDYYLADSAIFYSDGSASTAIETVSHGSGSMNAEGTYAPVKITAEQLGSSEFVDTLNKNLYDISKKLSAENVEAELKLWRLSDSGSAEISGETFVDDVIDASVFESGSGTKESPYLINTADQLRAFAASLTEHKDYTDTFIELMSDIDISDKEWTPIGDSSYAFNGSFDGKGHTVSGMTIGSADTAKTLENGKTYIGFFSILDTNAVVKELKLTNVMINVSYEASTYAGGIAAAMDSSDSGYK